MEVLEEQIRQIEEVAEYRAAMRSLKQPARAALVYGIWLYLVGYMEEGRHFIDPALFICGSVQVIFGLWYGKYPSLKGLVTNGVIMITIGLYNILRVVCQYFTRGYADPHPFFLMDVFMIAYGIRSFVLYKRLSQNFPSPPAEETLRSIDLMIAGIEQAKVTDSPDIIEIKEVPFLIPKKHGIRWKGLLLSDAVVLAMKFADPLFMFRSERLLCAKRNEVQLVVKRKLMLKKTWNATVHFGRKKMRGYIQQESLSRLQEWLSQDRKRDNMAEGDSEPQSSQPENHEG